MIKCNECDREHTIPVPEEYCPHCGSYDIEE
jgi:Zn finger protein HypA/HybF involved in hydrogenase expression